MDSDRYISRVFWLYWPGRWFLVHVVICNTSSPETAYSTNKALYITVYNEFAFYQSLLFVAII